MTVADAIHTSHTAARIDRLMFTVYTRCFTTLFTCMAMYTFVLVNHWFKQRMFGYESQQRADGTNGIAPRPSPPPCKHTNDRDGNE